MAAPPVRTVGDRRDDTGTRSIVQVGPIPMKDFSLTVCARSPPLVIVVVIVVAIGAGCNAGARLINLPIPPNGDGHLLRLQSIYLLLLLPQLRRHP